MCIRDSLRRAYDKRGAQYPDGDGNGVPCPYHHDRLHQLL